MKSFDKGCLPVVIDGNSYHLPQTLTPALRVLGSTGQLVTAARTANRAFSAAMFDEGEGLGKIESGEVTGSKECQELSTRLGDATEAAKQAWVAACRDLVVGLLEPVAEGQKIPKDIGDKIGDTAATDYAMDLLAGREIDPS